MPLSVHFGFAGLSFCVPDVCGADDPELGACEGFWVRSCRESKKDSDSTTITLRKDMNCPPVLLSDAGLKHPYLSNNEAAKSVKNSRKSKNQGLGPEVVEVGLTAEE